MTARETGAPEIVGPPETAAAQASADEGPAGKLPGPGRRVAAIDALRAMFDHPAGTLVAAFAVSALLGLALVAAGGGDPVFAAQVAIDSTVGTVSGAVNSIVFAAPRLLVALSAIVALRSGMFNLGGEGQLQVGGIGAVIGAVYGGAHLPGVLALPAALVGAIGFGAAWAGIAALLKIWRGADELVVTLLMNFVAQYFVEFLVQGPMKAAGTTFNQSERIPAVAELPQLFGTRLHAGAILAVVVTVLVAVLLSRTRLGLDLRAVGLNRVASRYQGLSVATLTLVAMLISGGIAGLAGASEVLGVQYRVIQGFSPGYGFEGLAIAFLAAVKPWRALALALVFGGIYSTALRLQQLLDVTASLAYVVEGIPIVLLACAGGWRLRRGPGRTE